MQERFHEISSQILSFNKIQEILENDVKLKLSAEAEERINKCRAYLDDKFKNSNEPLYEEMDKTVNFHRDVKLVLPEP